MSTLMWVMSDGTQRTMILMHRSVNHFLAMRWDFDDKAAYTAGPQVRAEAERTVTQWTEELEQCGSRLLLPPTDLDIPDPAWTDQDLMSWWREVLYPIAQQVSLSYKPWEPIFLPSSAGTFSQPMSKHW